MMQSFRQVAENLPFLGRFLVVEGLLLAFRHVGPPDRVDAQVFVQDHEEVVEPPLAETLVLELGIMGVRWVRLNELQ